MKMKVFGSLLLFLMFLVSPGMVLAGDYGSGPGILVPVNPVSVSVQPVPLRPQPVQPTIVPTIVPVPSPTGVLLSTPTPRPVIEGVASRSVQPAVTVHEGPSLISQAPEMPLEDLGGVIVRSPEIQTRLIRPGESSPMLMARNLPKAGEGREQPSPILVLIVLAFGCVVATLLPWRKLL